MIILKSPRELELMKQANQIVAEVHNYLEDKIVPGINTWEINRLGEELIRKKGAIPSFLGYRNYPASLCISINEEVVHGIPSKKKIIVDGDIVSLDIGAFYKGFHGDAARTIAVGSVEDEAKQIINVAVASFKKGLEQAVIGNRLFDISAAIQKEIESNRFSVVRDYVGHGIGRKMHEDPQLPNFGFAGRGPILKEGMTLALEPMVNAGTYQVKTLADGWTVVTQDGRLSAHYENTIAITPKGPLILSIL